MKQPSKTSAAPPRFKERDLSNTMPGYKINEYLLVLNPHEALRDKIMDVKKYFYETYKNPSAVYSKPHIALVNFVQYQMMEDKLVNRLHMIALGLPPVKIELKDYGSFPSHTIFINITSKVPIESLVKEIRAGAQPLMKLNNDNKPHFLLQPYLTIARKLQPWQYEKGWLEFSHLHFTGRFIADGMLLLKRAVGDVNYTVVRRFEFANLPVSTVQGNLF